MFTLRGSFAIVRGETESLQVVIRNSLSDHHPMNVEVQSVTMIPVLGSVLAWSIGLIIWKNDMLVEYVR